MLAPALRHVCEREQTYTVAHEAREMPTRILIGWT
jgi:hypothetical protein